MKAHDNVTELRLTRDPAEAFEFDVAEEVRRTEVRDEARRRIASKEAERLVSELPPQPTTLTDFLALDLGEEEFLIDGVFPKDGTAVLAAPNKSGKSTMVGNLLRSLVDGDAFLGCFEVTTPVQRVALVDNELSAQMLQRWLLEQRIQHTDRVQVDLLRGQAGAFNLLVPSVREVWARRLRGADVLILDCLRPALDGAGLNENTEASQFLRAGIAALCSEAEIPNVLVVHHTGHEGTRSRGDSAIQDWPDVKLGIEKPDGDHGKRLFKAFGRGVDVPPRQLEFNPATLRLTYDPDSVVVDSLDKRRKRTAEDKADVFREWLADQDATEPHTKSANKALAHFRESGRTVSDAAGKAAYKEWKEAHNA